MSHFLLTKMAYKNFLRKAVCIGILLLLRWFLVFKKSVCLKFIIHANG